MHIHSLISEKQATHWLLAMLLLLLGFHLLVMGKVFPSEWVWGGRLSSSEEVFKMEAFALLITLIFTLLVWIRHVRWHFFPSWLHRVLMGFLTAYFSINTLLNLLGTSAVEKWVFGPYVLVMAALSYRLAARF